MLDLLPDLFDMHADKLSLAQPIFNDYGGKKLFHGEIVTVSCYNDNSKVKELVATDGRNKVMVVDGGGSMRHALLGDMLAEKAAKNGWEGIIIYGCIRDVDVIMETELGVQALATNPLKTDKRGLGDVNVKVKFGGVDFVPGQFVYADNNGIIVSPEKLEMPED